jgi:hypothetical protein
MTTDQKGAIAEAKIIAAAVELGIPVLSPFNDGLRYDLVFDLGSLVRVQCKWASRRAGTIIVPFRSCRRGPEGFVRTKYTSAEVDAVAAYSPDTARCYFLPMEGVQWAHNGGPADRPVAEQPAKRRAVGEDLRVRRYTRASWGHSSVGRARRWQRRGRRFEPGWLHLRNPPLRLVSPSRWLATPPSGAPRSVLHRQPLHRSELERDLVGGKDAAARADRAAVMAPRVRGVGAGF